MENAGLHLFDLMDALLSPILRDLRLEMNVLTNTHSICLDSPREQHSPLYY